MNRDEIEGLIGTVLDCAEECRVRYLRPAMAKDLRDTAAALPAQQDRSDALEAGRLSMINSLILIAREARSSGNRTFDQCIDALTHIDDFCRA